AVLALRPLDGTSRPGPLGPVLESPEACPCLLPARPRPGQRLARLEQALLGVAIRLLPESIELVLVASLGLAEQTLSRRGQRPLLGLSDGDGRRRPDLSLACRQPGQERRVLGRQRPEPVPLLEEHQVEESLVRGQPPRLGATE